MTLIVGVLQCFESYYAPFEVLNLAVKVCRSNQERQQPRQGNNKGNHNLVHYV